MKQLLNILSLMALLMVVGCSSDRELEKVENVTESTDPLVFTCLSDESEQENTTRAASALLTTDFMVSTYKAFALGNQQLVMDKYHVEYKTSGTAWDGTVRPYWDYTGVPGQYERFWDYSNFPYRFNAVAPYPSSPAGMVLNDKQITINTPYKMQSCVNGMVTPSDAEPFVVAQVQRDPDGRDYDLMKTKGKTQINMNSSSKNRSVALPFHHLNSKVRFAIYSTAPYTTANHLYIKDLTIKVSSSNFATNATGYNAISVDGDYSWYRGTNNSGFTGVSYSTGPGTELLRFDGGIEVADNDMRHYQSRSSVYWLQCEGGIMQIPQEGVSMKVSFLLMDENNKEFKRFTDVPIALADGTDKYNWKSGYLNTYYLVIGGIEEKLEITFTATLTPWEDVTGSLSTDLEK